MPISCFSAACNLYYSPVYSFVEVLLSAFIVKFETSSYNHDTL